MSYALRVFVSSTCYELRDLRALIRQWLEDHGLSPQMSDANGFPTHDGLPPYASCLRVLEECPLVIAVIDRRYGTVFDDWGPYEKYRGLAPTHAEIVHALTRGKRTLIFVQEELWTFYEVWRKNGAMFEGPSLPSGLQRETLLMFHEIKQRKPAPWIRKFGTATEITKALQLEFVNELYAHLHARERETTDTATFLLEKLTGAAPNVRQQIERALNPDLIREKEALEQRLAEIERQLAASAESAEQQVQILEEQKTAVARQLDGVRSEVSRLSVVLAHAAIRDATWLDLVRRTLMPKTPGRVPFHNSAEIALRGFHVNQYTAPTLGEVTWAKLPLHEGGLHRGYDAGLIFRGNSFAPGTTWTLRRKGEPADATRGEAGLSWRPPNIYFGDYLEVSTGGDENEGPLSWRGYEFCVRNPGAIGPDRSTWVEFTYAFDDQALERIRCGEFERGQALLRNSLPAEAVEPLRKAMVFADRMLGEGAPETLAAKAQWELALDGAALARLRFRVGDRLAISSGTHAGKSGIVARLLLRHHHAYVIDVGDGEVYASDEQVERST